MEPMALPVIITTIMTFGQTYNRCCVFHKERHEVNEYHYLTGEKDECGYRHISCGGDSLFFGEDENALLCDKANVFKSGKSALEM